MADIKRNFKLILTLGVVVTLGTFFLQIYQLTKLQVPFESVILPLILNLLAAMNLGFLFAWTFYFSNDASRAKKILSDPQLKENSSELDNTDRTELKYLQTLTADLERISQLLAFTNYSEDLSKQLKVAFNLAQEIFPNTAFLVFLRQGSELVFSSGSQAKSGNNMEVLDASSPIVKKAIDSIGEKVDLKKLADMQWKSFGLPLKTIAKDDNTSILPLSLWNRILGLVVFLHENQKVFSKKENFLANLFNRHLANFIENHSLFREKIQQGRLLKEVEIARKIQMDSLPLEFISPKGLDLIGTCLPCNETSGDYYDFLPLADGRFFIVIADVSSKGLPAALFLSKVQTLVRAMVDRFKEPASFLAFLSSHFSKESMSLLYATMIMIMVVPDDKKLYISNAGHCKPILIKADGSDSQFVEFAAGIPLGLFESDPEGYENRAVALDPGDSLLLYSDGLSELVGPNGKRMNADSLRKLVQNSDRSSSKHFVKWLQKEIENFRLGIPFEDDLTVVFLRAENLK
ncbi:MAG: SpoIIE family protein phosphatase [Candidatus Riflebacteria bacterium]|nr:SpoIIE family protein phosphatase [Candidatus Riflebacteria bacterium]